MKSLGINFTPGRGGQKIRLIVIHTMECGETVGKAKQVWNWFAGKTSPKASAHYMTDSQEVFQLISDDDTAWAVDDFTLNQQSISIELAGSASQTPAQWADAYSASELEVVAKLSAELAKKYGIPAVKLSLNDILSGKAGFCGHADITAAKKIKGGHTDPGVNFPWSAFLPKVQSLLN
jgi:N-acetyl-anhydromuramyl-L-alanine amidase AmpD